VNGLVWSGFLEYLLGLRDGWIDGCKSVLVVGMGGMFIYGDFCFAWDGMGWGGVFLEAFFER